MADQGFKYSVFPKDLAKKDPRDIGFSSKYTTLKTFTSGVTSKSCNAGAYTTHQVPHGLSYRPAFNVYFRDTLSGEVYQMSSGFDEEDFQRSGAEINVHAASDNYNLTFSIYNNAGVTKNVDIFYEVFYEDLVTEPVFIFG